MVGAFFGLAFVSSLIIAQGIWAIYSEIRKIRIAMESEFKRLRHIER
jgi:hypothetical protein